MRQIQPKRQTASAHTQARFTGKIQCLRKITPKRKCKCFWECNTQANWQTPSLPEFSMKFSTKHANIGMEQRWRLQLCNYVDEKWKKKSLPNFGIDFNLLTDLNLNCHSMLFKTLIILHQAKFYLASGKKRHTHLRATCVSVCVCAFE